MIAIESFKRFRIIDITAIFLLSCLWGIISLLSNTFFGPQSSYILSLFIATFLMSFTVHLVRKAGSATLFYGLGALLTYTINDFGTVGFEKFLVFFIAGVLFELIFLIFKIEIKNLQIDIIAGTAFSSAFIPLTLALLLSPTIAVDMIISFLNMMLLSFFIGIAGAILSFLIWYNLRTTKIVLKFEYTQ